MSVTSIVGSNVCLIVAFHNPRFSNKPLAIFGSLWLVMNWILACGLLPRPLVTFDKGFLFGVSDSCVHHNNAELLIAPPFAIVWPRACSSCSFLRHIRPPTKETDILSVLSDGLRVELVLAFLILEF